MIRQFLASLMPFTVSAVRDGEHLSEADGRLYVSELRTGMERIQPYGLATRPLEGARGLVAFLGGRRDQPLVIGIDDTRYTLRGLQSGEVALYDDQGQTIILGRDGISVSAKSVKITTPEFEMTASSAKINGKAIATVDDVVAVGSGSSSGRWPIVTGVGTGD